MMMKTDLEHLGNDGLTRHVKIMKVIHQEGKKEVSKTQHKRTKPSEIIKEKSQPDINPSHVLFFRQMANVRQILNLQALSLFLSARGSLVLTSYSLCFPTSACAKNSEVCLTLSSIPVTHSKLIH